MNSIITRFFLLSAAVFAAYFNALDASFQFDDYKIIVNNPVVHSFSGWLSEFPRGIRPLLKLTYVLNWHSESSPLWFHLFNIAVHSVNTLLVYLLSLRLFDRSRESFPLKREFAATIVALLFALHPVQTEAVTYISGRSMSLMTLFYLASLLAYIDGVRFRKKSLLNFLSPALFVAAVSVKEVAITLPLALILWEAADGSRKNWGLIFRMQAVHWLLLLSLALLLAGHRIYGELFAYSLDTRTIGSNLLSQVNGISYLLSRLVFIRHLSIDPDLPVLSSWTPQLAAMSLFLLALCATGIVCLRRTPWVGFGLLWFFLHIAPTNSIIPRLDIANERHMYLACWGIFLAIGGELGRLQAAVKLNSKMATAVAAIFFLILGLSTAIRNRHYQTEISLWEATIKISPGNARAHNNLGYAYVRAGRTREGLEEYRQALQLRPGYVRVKKNIFALQHALKTPKDLPDE